MIPYTLIRAKRKTVCLKMVEGKLEVRAPHHVPISFIEDLIREKDGWIREHLENFKALQQTRASHTLNYGDTISYMGTPYTIEPRFGAYIGWDLDLHLFYVPSDLNSEQIRQAIIQILRSLGQVSMTLKAIDWSINMGVKFNQVKITGAQTRWGSCSSLGNLNFSWRLLLADEALIDYIVVHELAHLKEMNHQEGFWAIVKDVMPDYQVREAQLKRFRATIDQEGW